MGIEDSVIFIFFNSIHTYVLYKFLTTVLFSQRQVSRKVELSAYALDFVLGSFFSLFFGVPLITLAFSISSTLLLSFCYKSKISYKFLAVFLSKAIFIIIEIFIFFLSQALQNNFKVDLTGDSTYSSIGAQILALSAKFIVVYTLASGKRRRQVRKNAMFALSNRSSIILSIIPIISIISIVGMDQLRIFSNQQIVMTAAILLLVNIICFEVYNILRASLLRDVRNKIRDSDSKHNKLHYEIVKDQITAEKIRKHTLKDYLLLLKVSSRDELVSSVVDQLLRENYLVENVVATGMQGLDDILNLKIGITKAYQVDYKIEIKIPKKLDVDDGILITLISQIWEIALDQAKYSKDHVLEFSLTVEKETLIIRTRCGLNAELEDKTYLERLALCYPVIEPIEGDISSTVIGCTLLIQVTMPYMRNYLFRNRILKYS